jgi:superfamily II DNA/RNA helicase
MTNDFKELGISARLVEKLRSKNIHAPTRIQEEAIPKILAGQDVIGQSRSGTGKTLAYLLPLLEISERKASGKKDKVLIIAPTNELARQIYNDLVFYSDPLYTSSALLSGGLDIDKQINDLKKNFDFIAGVPGRILKLADSGALKLSAIKKIVLDEADFLIDLGFLEDIQKIMSNAMNVKQFMIFSATLSSNTKKFLDIVHSQKYAARVDSKNTIPPNIENYFFPVRDEEREEALFKIIKAINPFLAIIFVRTRETGKYLNSSLRKSNISSVYLSGDLTQAQRKKSLNDFKKAKYQYLVATDLASRGLDIESITHIINYNLPVNELDYLHRAGRTGRMGEKGIVYSLCNELDEAYLKKYAAFLNLELKAVKFSKGGIIIDEKYKGVKPRFNIEELKKQEKINKRRKNINADKEKRSKKGR